MDFIGGMLLGGMITLFAILLCAAGKDDDK